MKFHLLDNLCDDSEKLRNIKLLHAALYQQFNVVFKSAYRGTSLRRATIAKDGLCFEVDCKQAKKEIYTWIQNGSFCSKGRADSNWDK